MPLNEILATSYLVVHYTMTLPNAPHVFRLYIDSEISVDTDGRLVFASLTDPEHLTGWSAVDIVMALDTRLSGMGGSYGAYTIDSVEGWRSAAGENEFVALDAASYAGINGGAGDVIGSAYYVWTFRAAGRQTFKLWLFDSPVAAPKNTHPAVPLTDDSSVAWFMLHGPIPFVTNDNLPLVNLSSLNTGYNDKLAESYGRAFNS